MDTNTKNEVVVTLKGMKALVQGYGQGQVPVVEIDPMQSIALQLMEIDPTKELVVIVPDRMNQQHAKAFKDKVFNANGIRKIYSNTHLKIHHQCTMNTLNNYDHFMARNGRPITEVKKPAHYKRALIVGNGPSVYTLEKRPEETMIISSWHSASKLLEKDIIPDFVIHIDVNNPHHNFTVSESFPVETAIIAAPTCAPFFLNQYYQNPLYMYFGADFPIHGWFAQRYGIPEHALSHGTVVGAALYCAIYMGYKTLAILGVDFGTLEPNEEEYHVENLKLQNQFGNTVYTVPQYVYYKEGLEHIAAQNPEVQFQNLSQVGLDIKGFEPMALSKF